MDNFNIDKNTMDKLNSMLKNGNLNDMLSQISPDTLKNFSNMMNGNSSNDTSNNVQSNSVHQEAHNASSADSPNPSGYSSNTNNFDFSNIDINTMMKMKSVIEKMNDTSDPRKNLLQSLKPYLRDEKKSKLDQYSQLLNMTSLIELFNQTNGKENSRDQ